MRRIVLLLVAVIALPAAAQKRILFIGNSLTAANDLPRLVCAIAKDSGHDAVCESVVFGNFSLNDHILEGTAVRRIRDEKWDVVVLQQGPSALDESRAELIQVSRRFGKMIRKAGGTPALYSVWPWRSRSFDFPNVAETYRLAARSTDGLYFPVTDAWTRVQKRDKTIALYGPDDFHPTLAATYLASMVIHKGIFGDLTENLPPLDKLTTEQVGVLREAALQAR